MTQPTPTRPSLGDHPALRRRRGGAAAALVTDLAHSAAWTRNWIILFALLLTLFAVIAAATAQTVVPLLIYPVL